MKREIFLAVAAIIFCLLCLGGVAILIQRNPKGEILPTLGAIFLVLLSVKLMLLYLKK